MNIIWNKNPLYTVIELNELEKEILKLKTRIYVLEEEIICSAYFALEPKHQESLAKFGKGSTIDERIAEALDELSLSYLFSEGEYKDKGLDARVNTLYDYFLADLGSYHIGDCTCVATSCTKCHAESLLGVNTMAGLGKHSAYKIDSAFGKNNERTIDEVLEHLKNYKITPPTENLEGWAKVGGWEQHVPRWTAEAKSAYEWLLAYRQAHPEVAG